MNQTEKHEKNIAKLEAEIETMQAREREVQQQCRKLEAKKSDLDDQHHETRVAAAMDDNKELKQEAQTIKAEIDRTIEEIDDKKILEVAIGRKRLKLEDKKRKLQDEFKKKETDYLISAIQKLVKDYNMACRAGIEYYQQISVLVYEVQRLDGGDRLRAEIPEVVKWKRPKAQVINQEGCFFLAVREHKKPLQPRGIVYPYLMDDERIEEIRRQFQF